eukprot:gene15622-18521_t
MVKDSCYYKVKNQYAVFPSARASQAIAKCRKEKGAVRKTQAGNDLKRWASEKWVNTDTGKPCGSSERGKPYCRPTKKVSASTATLRHDSAAQRTNQRRKQDGKKANSL